MNLIKCKPQYVFPCNHKIGVVIGKTKVTGYTHQHNCIKCGRIHLIKLPHIGVDTIKATKKVEVFILWLAK